VAPDIGPNESEDLVKNNLESNWVDDTLNDIAATFDIGTLPLGMLRRMSLWPSRGSLCRSVLLRLLARVEPVIELTHVLDLSGPSFGVLPRDDSQWGLT
jgi:hypothetical protein